MDVVEGMSQAARMMQPLGQRDRLLGRFAHVLRQAHDAVGDGPDGVSAHAGIMAAIVMGELVVTLGDVMRHPFRGELQGEPGLAAE